MRSKFLIIIMLLIFTCQSIFACKTPVYKYALKNWVDRDYYQIIKVYESKKKSSSKKDAAVVHLIEKMLKEKGELSNIDFIAIEKSEDIKNTYGEFTDELIQEALKKQKMPFYIITNPAGTNIYTGKLSKDDIPSLLASPARVKMAEELSKEKIVLLYIASKDEAKNKKAEEALREGIKDVIKEELSFRKESDDPDITDEDKKNFKPLKVTYVKIDPTDKKEIWFRRQLSKVSLYMMKETNEPIVLGVVGRGFVFENYLSKETLSKEGIADLVFFLSGPCSCTVKSGNPGLDILTTWDWDKTVNSTLEDKDPEEIEGFGGEEIDDPTATPVIPEDAKSKDAGESKASKNEQPLKLKDHPADAVAAISSDYDQTGDSKTAIASQNDFMKIVLFAIIGLGICLLLITKLMKANKE